MINKLKSVISKLYLLNNIRNSILILDDFVYTPNKNQKTVEQ